MLFTLTHVLAKYSWVPSAGVICGSIPLGFALAATGGIICTPATFISDGLPRRLRDDALESGLHMFQQVLNLVLEHFNSVEIVWHGDRLPEEKENAILMCNHQSGVDWILIGMMASRQGCAGSVRFMIKYSLQYVPIVGYYLQLIGCAFVKRGAGDCRSIHEQLQYAVSNHRPIWWVVFPEGTRYDVTKPHLLTASHQFAQERGLPTLQHVLVPKSKGFEASVEALRGHCPAVYDVTVVYTARSGGGGLRCASNRSSAPSLRDFASGHCSRVDVHIDRVDMDSIPDNPEERREWLMQRFIMKDKILTEFYDNHAGQLVDGSYHWPLSLRRSLVGALPIFLGFGLYFSRQGRAFSLSLTLASSVLGIVGCLMH